MTNPAEFRYDMRLNILHKPLELIDEKALADAAPPPWYNQTLCKVNASVVRIGVVKGEYHWHKHDDDDEFFYVVEGNLLIDLENRTVALAPRQGFVVPKGDPPSHSCRAAYGDAHVRERSNHPDRRLAVTVSTMLEVN